MMVARHEMPGRMKRAETVPEERLIRLRLMTSGRAKRSAVPTGRGPLIVPVPRHFMPGYHHSVPPGQIPRLSPTIPHAVAKTTGVTNKTAWYIFRSSIIPALSSIFWVRPGTTGPTRGTPHLFSLPYQTRGDLENFGFSWRPM
jgi:hypothetical protein